MAIGDLQGGPLVSSLGEFDSALASYNRGAQIAGQLLSRDPADSSALELVSRAWLKIGDVEFRRSAPIQGLEDFKKAVAAAERLQSSERPAYGLLAEGYNRIGRARFEAADPKGAVEAMSRSLQAAEQWVTAGGGEEAETSAVRSHGGLASCLKISGDLPHAIQQARLAEAIALRMYQKHPGNPTFAVQLVRAWLGLSNITGEGLPEDTFDVLAAADGIAKAVRLAESTAAADPKNALPRAILAVAWVLDGRSQQARDPRYAALLIRKSVGLASELAAGDPSNSAYQPNLAFLHMVLGEALLHTGEYDESVEHLLRALELQERFQNFALLSAFGSIKSLILLGDAQLSRGKTDARSYYDRALARAEEYWSGHNSDLRTNYYLAESYEGLGRWARRRGELRQARDWYQKSLDIWTAWPRRGVSSGYDKAHAERAARAVDECKTKLSRGQTEKAPARAPGPTAGTNF